MFIVYIGIIIISCMYVLYGTCIVRNLLIYVEQTSFEFCLFFVLFSFYICVYIYMYIHLLIVYLCIFFFHLFALVYMYPIFLD